MRKMNAIGFMLAAVFMLSTTPLVFALGHGPDNPFLYTSSIRLGILFGCGLFLLLWYYDIILIADTWKYLLVRLKRPEFILLVMHDFDFALFAWSGHFLDIATIAVIYEIWPIPTFLLMAWLYKKTNRYKAVSAEKIALMCLGLLSVSLVIAAQVGGFHDLWTSLGGSTFKTWSAGLALVLLAALATSLAAFGFKWSTDAVTQVHKIQEVRVSGNRQKSIESLDLFCVIFAFVASNTISTPTNAAVGIVLGETLTPMSFSIAFLAGLVPITLGSILWRKSNLLADDPAINAIGYGIPALALGWLSIFSLIGVTGVDYLTIGTAAIITSNLLINFEAEMRWGFKALLLGLLTFGAFVYLRDGLFEVAGIDHWYWEAGGYFESITLAATVFILLLAFRIARLVSRTSDEDNRTFVIYRKLDLLSRRGIIDPLVCVCILRIDQANNSAAAEREAYLMARKYIADVDPEPLNEADTQLLSDAESHLDALARSKQVDVHFGEMFGLFIFATVTIGLAILSLPPKVDGWTRLLVDMFAMVTSAVTLFLLIHMQDLQRERDQPKLEVLGFGLNFRDYTVRFFDTAKRSSDQWLSLAVGAGLVISYFLLFAYKWIG